MTRSIRVFCVDDNPLLADALQRRLASEKDMSWVGWIGEPGSAVRAVLGNPPDVVMLDIDMPGQNSFDVVRQLAKEAPEVRVLMFSGHVRPDYLDRAIDAGAWGYVSKHDTMEDILAAIRRAAAGEFVVTADVQKECLPGA
jgi:two-component system, NarL family, response regulator DesR